MKQQRKLFWLGLATMATIAGCSQEHKLASNSGAFKSGLYTLDVSSDAFRDQHAIPAKYTADGDNVSPPLSWSGQKQAQEYILIVQDADSHGKPDMLWLVYNIPPDVTSLPENAAGMAGAKFQQGLNYKGGTGYAGPDVKSGKPHRIFFQVIALDTPVHAPPGSDLATVEDLFIGGVLCNGRLVGTYVKQ
jgi:Raf kinase inhibitor-like YbhB/YbcL family protein